MEHLFPYPKMGHSWLEILHDPLTRKLLGFDAVHAEKTPFISGVNSRLTFLLQDPTRHLSFLKIGYTALEAFLQANCTGPPLDFNPEDSIFPDAYRADAPALKKELLEALSVDGNAVYPLTPHIELFWLAKTVMANPTLADAGFNGRRARFRVDFWHQKLLTEKSDTLHTLIYSDADILEHQLASRLTFGGAAAEEHFVEFLTERAALRIFYGDDEKAREDLTKAAKTRHFQFALTGALGKRTKFQEDDISQLVILARSRDHEPEPYSSRKSSRAEGMESRKGSQDLNFSSPGPRNPSIPSSYDHGQLAPRPRLPGSSKSHDFPKPHEHDYQHHVSPLAAAPVKPETLLLNDDTLLERIQFKQMPPYEPEMTKVTEASTLPPRLADLDPSEQPLLFPVDSIILLSTASSISNTSPADGLTREETLPYATRVLDGGSSNWQVYTQALLVRSRIEGYRTRTAERGLLQLQALVDQVIAETESTTASTHKVDGATSHDRLAPTTFLPKLKPSEAASVADRLKYIYQLSPPLRWELEAELASRWTAMGGLKSAFEIYQRLQMNAEVALCLAATDQEAEAVKLLKSLLFAEDEATTDPKLRSPPAAESPRLLCILGDITSTPSYYALAWKTSSSRYGRAQRSLGRHYVKQHDFKAAAEAYQLALQRARLDHGTWFALGCVQLELEEWQGAVESFTRCVQLEDKDAESWSNLAVALLSLPAAVSVPTPESTGAHPRHDSTPKIPEDDEDDEADPGFSSEERKAMQPYQHSYEALRALRRAATLKRDDPRIWDNYLTVAASIPPSAGTPWADILQAMTRVIELRSKKEGEGCVDLKILDVLVQYVTESFDYPGDGVGDEDLRLEADEEEDDEDDEEAISDEDEDEDEEKGPTDVDGATESASQAAARPTATTSMLLPYIPRALLSLIDTSIASLATSSPELYLLLARVALWRHRPAESLSYHEKAWRASTSVPGVYESEKGWNSAVQATTILTQAYQTLGDQERERTGGKVEAGWKFKAKNAVRSVLGRGKDWEGGKGWGELDAVKTQLG